jgi:WD40 repeat protein
MNKLKHAILFLLISLIFTIYPTTAQETDGIVITPENADQVVELMRIGRGTIGKITISPDGEILVIVSAIGVWFYDTDTLEILRFMEYTEFDEIAVVFSPDGDRILCATSDDIVQVWDISTGNLVHTLETTTWNIAFSPDGTRFAYAEGRMSVDEHKIQVKDVMTGDAIFTLEITTNITAKLSFSPDGSRIASGSNLGIQIWDAANGELLNNLEGQEGDIESIVFSPDDTLIASGSENGTVRVWDMETGEFQHVFTLSGEYPAWFVSFSPDSTKIIASNLDRIVSVWDTAKGETLFTIVQHESPVTNVYFSPDGEYIVTGSLDGEIHFWDAITGDHIRTLEGHTGLIGAITFSPDGTQIISGNHLSGMVQIWDTTTGELLNTSGGDMFNFSITLSPDGSRNAAGSQDGLVEVRDTQTGDLLHTLQGHTDRVDSIAFSNDGTRIVTGSMDGLVHVWDAANGEIIHTFDMDTYVFSVTFSSDDRLIAAGGLGTIAMEIDGTWIWDAITGELLTSFWGHEWGTHSIAFSQDNTRIATGGGWGNPVIGINDVTTGERLFRLRGYEVGDPDYASGVFSPDSSLIVTSAPLGGYPILIWDSETGEIIHTLDVSSVATIFSSDGTRIVTGGWDGTIRIWGIPSDQ